MMRLSLSVLLLVSGASALARCHSTRTVVARRTSGPVATVRSSLFDLVERRDFSGLVTRAGQEPASLLELVKDAGVAGAIAYTVVELSFFAIALPIGYFAWHASTGEWLQPLLLLREDGVDGKARVLGLLLSYIVLLKSLFPVRLGSTLLLTPTMKRLLDGLQPVAVGASERAEALKSELLELASASRGGIEPFSNDEQARFDSIVKELTAFTPIPSPASSAAFSGEWECRWTTESELNFVVDKGLLGQPWVRTYQIIDVAGGKLENVIECVGDSCLRVGSTIAPDDDDEEGRRFNFSFDRCALRWRSIEVPLPPVGRGWGVLVYLDETLRIQCDVRGDMLIAEKVPPKRVTGDA